MSEQGASLAAQGQPAAQFALQRIYIKDTSFESPRAPAGFRSEWKPHVNMELNTTHTSIEQDMYEVVLGITVTARNDAEDVIYLIEVQQAGIFSIRGLEPEPLAQTLGSFCPSVLFPYARELIDSMAVRGSFPPLMLPPTNFDALYAEAKKRAAVGESAQPH